MEGITTSDNPASQTRPMEGITIDGTARPTIEEFSEELISSGGLDDSRHAPNRTGIGNSSPENAPDNGRDSQTAGNSGDPPLGRENGGKNWVESGGNRKNAKATRRADLPRTLGCSSWKLKYPT
jgi:hypothetical protein